jgi:hypothetical protein
VYIPIINRHLSNWVNAWVHHPLTSEKNHTPMQLWIKGLQTAVQKDSTVAREAFQVSTHGAQTLNP